MKKLFILLFVQLLSSLSNNAFSTTYLELLDQFTESEGRIISSEINKAFATRTDEDENDLKRKERLAQFSDYFYKYFTSKEIKISSLSMIPLVASTLKDLIEFIDHRNIEKLIKPHHLVAFYLYDVSDLLDQDYGQRFLELHSENKADYNKQLNKLVKIQHKFIKNLMKNRKECSQSMKCIEDTGVNEVLIDTIVKLIATKKELKQYAENKKNIKTAESIAQEYETIVSAWTKLRDLITTYIKEELDRKMEFYSQLADLKIKFTFDGVLIQDKLVSYENEINNEYKKGSDRSYVVNFNNHSLKSISFEDKDLSFQFMLEYNAYKYFHDSSHFSFPVPTEGTIINFHRSAKRNIAKSISPRLHLPGIKAMVKRNTVDYPRRPRSQSEGHALEMPRSPKAQKSPARFSISSPRSFDRSKDILDEKADQ